MRNPLSARSQPRLFGPPGLAALSVLALCLPTASGTASSAVAATGPARNASHVIVTGHGGAAGATMLAASATGVLPAGGVLGDVTGGGGVADILAIDGSGNLWLYPNTGSGDAGMFADGRIQVGQGWTGYTLAAVGPLHGSAPSGLLAIDPAGNLWYYPNAIGTGLGAFPARIQVGIGWNGYTVVGLTGLYDSVYLGILAIDPAGNLWYYANTGGTGLGTFGARSQVGQGWIGYTADVANINSDGFPDIVAVDSSGNMWLYLNTAGGTGFSTFAAPVQVGSGFAGYQAVDVGPLTSASIFAFRADVLAINPAGNLLYYPNTGGTGTSTFGTPVQVGSGWTGYRIN
jgi:hypothetical protein